MVSSQVATLKAASMTVSGFAYLGGVSLPTSGGSVLAMEFTMANADLTGMTLALTCQRNVRWYVATPASAITIARSGMTLYATEFVGTTGSGAFDWTPAPSGTSTVPNPDPLGGGAGTISGVTITLVAATVPGLGISQSSVAASAC